MDILWNFVFFIIAIGILVTIHEWGHFWVARRCGVYVQQFSIGFGRAIWKKRDCHGTLYTISMIPLGGYVKMLDSRLEVVAQKDQHKAFDLQPVAKRFAIVAAGPICNFVFAFFAYWWMFILGSTAVKPIVGEILPHSIAEQSRLKVGAEIISVSGKATGTWQDVTLALLGSIGEQQARMVVLSPQGGERQLILNLTDWDYDPETQSLLKTLGIQAFQPKALLEIAEVSAGSAAQLAGIAVTDEIIRANNEVLTSWQALVDIIHTHPHQPVDLVILRSGQQISKTLIPDEKIIDSGERIGYAGLRPSVEPWPQEYTFDLKYGIFESIGKAVQKTTSMIQFTFQMLKKLVTGDLGLNTLSGPVSIAKGAGATAHYGLVSFLGFLALISVNLGIINLLPLPVLDGGHLLFFVIEMIIGRPIPDKYQEISFRVGGIMMFFLMSVALFNDFARL